MRRLNLRVNVEYGDLKASFEGTPEEVFEAFIRFLTDALPSFSIVSKILITTDIAGLMDELEGIVKISSEGQIVIENTNLSVYEGVCLTLTGAYVGCKLGVLDDSSLQPTQIGRMIGKAPKTVRNELPNLIRKGLVERVGKGRYMITSYGLLEVQRRIIPKIKGVLK